MSTFIVLYINFINLEFKKKYPVLYDILNFTCLTIILFSIIFVFINSSYPSKSGSNDPTNSKNTGNSGGPSGPKNPSSTMPSSSKRKHEDESKDAPVIKKVRAKPNLTVKVGPETPLEKDVDKISKCEHESYGIYQAGSKEEVDNTFCDFMGAEQSNAQHQAFKGIGDNAFLCNHCSAITCKDCVESYSSSEE